MRIHTMILGAMIGVLVLSLAVPSYAARKAVASKTLASTCTTTESASSKKYIYKNSAPLRSGGVGTPLVGYRKEPTLIMNTNNSAKGTATVYAKNGKAIGRCPWASAHGHAGGRYRCSMSTAGLRKSAVSNGGSAEIYFLIHSRKKLCVKVDDAGRCYGSVKGLCGQLIK